jgi:hypothetical protein
MTLKYYQEMEKFIFPFIHPAKRWRNLYFHSFILPRDGEIYISIHSSCQSYPSILKYESKLGSLQRTISLPQLAPLCLKGLCLKISHPKSEFAKITGISCHPFLA